MRDDKQIEKSNNTINTLFYLFLCTGIIPLLIIFCIYMHNPESPILSAIVSSTKDLPEITSNKSPLMTKVMDVYCKTAPLLAIIWFICSLKFVIPNKIAEKKLVLRACVIYPFFYLFIIYPYLFTNRELTTSGIPFKTMSTNNYSLLLVYVIIYLSILCLTYCFFLIPLLLYKIKKERR